MLHCYCVARLLFVLSYVLIVCTVPLPPGVNPIAVDKYIYIYNVMPPSTDVGAQTQNTTDRSITNSPVQILSLKSSCFVFKIDRYSLLLARD